MSGKEPPRAPVGRVQTGMASFCKPPPTAEQREQQHLEEGQKFKQQVQKQACRQSGTLPLRIGAASTKLYIERGADWCGQGKNNSFFEGCGMSTCQYGIYQTGVLKHRASFFLFGASKLCFHQMDFLYIQSSLHIRKFHGKVTLLVCQ